MRNEKLRQEKIARNKKRRKQRKKHPKIFNSIKEYKLYIKSYFVAGSRHGARLYRRAKAYILKQGK